jgi:hypothetical protein
MTKATILVMLASALAVGACKKPTPSEAAASNEKPVVVKATDLQADYQKNEVAADEKYKGKRVRVVGQLDAIEKDAFDDMIVRVKAPPSLLGVHATMRADQKSKVVALQKDQVVAVECTGRGFVLGTVQPRFRSGLAA